jgi:hypothetical protein
MLFIGALGAFFLATAATNVSDMDWIDHSCNYVDRYTRKLYFMNHVTSTVLTVFVASMVIKNFGIVFIGVGMIVESMK